MTPETRGTARDRLFRRADRGVLLYGVTPPRRITEPERADAIAGLTLGRLAAVAPDGLVLYDVDAEADRTPGERPFPFTPMMDPAHYLDRHLGAWSGPVVVYRAVGKYSEGELSTWLAGADPEQVLTVLVGAASAAQPVRTRLDDAYRLHAATGARLPLGAVLIPERHARRGDEHSRMLRKQDRGCGFFISQVCYDVDHTRDVLSDYAYACRDAGVAPSPVVVTLAPCGSQKTLDFMTWLGIDVPRWVSNEIRYAEDPLAESFEQCLSAARQVIAFCRRLGLPFGLSVESLTNRKVEIEAAVELAVQVRGLLGRDRD